MKLTEHLGAALAYLGEKPKAVALLMERRAIACSAASGYVKFRAPRLQTRAIVHLAKRLAVAERELLAVSDISERTYRRRRSRQEPLTSGESDRLLRIARIAAEAERVFGSPAKSRRWLTADSCLLGAKPLSLLGFDMGAREVERELGRIDFGDFA